MTRISTGTVTVTNNSKDVTAWVGEGGVTLSPITAPVGSQVVIDGYANYVEARPSTTTLTLVLPHKGPTGTLKEAVISAITSDEVSIATLNQRTATVIQELETLDANGRGLFYNSIGVTGNSDPGAGNLAFNSSTPNLISAVYLDNIDANSGGRDVSGIIEFFPSGSVLIFRSLDTNAYYAFVVANTAVDEGGHYSIPLTYLSHDGILSSEPVSIEWRLSGKDNDSDAVVNNLAGRAAYDAQPAGFRVFVSDIGDGRAARYTKLTNASGDWSAAGIYTGPVGPAPDLEIGTVTTLANGVPATAGLVPILGGYSLDLGLPRGDQGIQGIQGIQGEGLHIDASGTLAGRAAYDAEPEGFTYVDDISGLMYIRQTAVAGTWSAGIEFLGQPGADGALITTTTGVGNGTAGPYTLSAAPVGLESVVSASISGVEQYDYTITGTGPYYITFGLVVPSGVAWQVKQAGPLSVGTVGTGVIEATHITDDAAKQRAISTKLGVGVVSAIQYGAVFDNSPTDNAKIKTAYLAANAAGKPFIVPTQGLTINVPGDFSTVQAALDATVGWIFPSPPHGMAAPYPNATNHIFYPILIIKIAQGIYTTVGAGNVAHHPNGKFIRLDAEGWQGLTYASYQGDNYTSGVHLVTLRFSTWPAIDPIAGQGLRIVNPTGTGDYRALKGLWRIHAVNPTNKDITIVVWSRKKTANFTMTLTGGIFVFMSVALRYTNVPNSPGDIGGFDVLTDLNVGDGIMLVGSTSNDATTNGFMVRSGASLRLGQYCGAIEFQRAGLWALDGAHIELGQGSFCGNDVSGINAIQDAFVSGHIADCQGNGTYNVIANTGAYVCITDAGFDGSNGKGIAVYNGGRGLFSGHANNNTVGLELLQGGMVSINSMEIASNSELDIKFLSQQNFVHATSLASVGTTNPPKNIATKSGGGIFSDVIPFVKSGNHTFSVVSVAAGAQYATAEISVPGATIGMEVKVRANIALSGVRIWGAVTSAGNITLYLTNNTASGFGPSTFTGYYVVREADL